MKRFVKIITMISSVLMAASCFGIDENDYKELAPIDFNEVKDASHLKDLRISQSTVACSPKSEPRKSSLVRCRFFFKDGMTELYGPISTFINR